MAGLNQAVDNKLVGVRSTMDERLQSMTGSLVQSIAEANRTSRQDAEAIGQLLGGMRETIYQVRASLEERITVVFGEHLRNVDQIRTELAVATLQTRTEMAEALATSNDSLVKTVAGFGPRRSRKV